ncbi:MAG: sigma-E factor negative regulatory protein [Xanthomonadaceae bacterium]|nr:sigma-E factor negative regulatory protein [Xanthomonadaceae bacterium]
MTGMHDIDTKHNAQGREFHREQLSAMMDDALSADESRFLLRRMEHDDELADCWQRWQFYGDAMRGGAGRALPADFAQRVGRAIADDIAAVEAAPVHAARGGRPFLYWGGGAALAASVALAALFGSRLGAPAGADLQVASAPSPMAVAPIVPGPTLPATPEPAPAPVMDVGNAAGAVAAATVVAAAAVSEQRRDSKPRIMAASRAESERSALASRAPREASRARQDGATSAAAAAPVLTYASADTLPRAAASSMPSTSAAKAWPRALVPGASQTDDVVVTYPIETTRRSPFQPDFVPLIDASQAEQAGRGH